MKIDLATLAFGYSLKDGTGTPNWATSLGQGKGYRINESTEINEILKGLIYKSQSPEKISTKIGKGGVLTSGDSENSPIVIGAVFTEVWINNIFIPNGRFILIITRDTSKSHSGRLKLKYGPSNTYTETGTDTSFSNEDFFKLARKTLKLADNACWFVTEISIENQDVLKLKAIVVDSEKSVEYKNSEDLHNAWTRLEPSLLKVNTSSSFSPNQIIFYGVPGSGKSYCIDSKLKELGIDDKEDQTKRVVFHPEYTNNDFVGQILPKVENNLVKYEFVEGPFTAILKKAYENKSKHYALIIEEINRGNAAAIFGELFQLLDRFDKDESETASEIVYDCGWSSYCVNNDNINEFLRKDYDETDAFIPKELFDKYGLNIGIRIPPNLSLFATMNTSDQNVFTLDNAFKRRWDLQLIPNRFVFDSVDTVENKKQYDQCFADVEEFDFKWGAFVNAINKKIINNQSGEDISSFEDKQLGMWFVKAVTRDGEDNKIITKELFLHKVIEYLFDDVFKLDPTLIFKGNTLGDLIEMADNDPCSIFAEGVIDSVNAEQENLDKLKETAIIG